ncbi:MAG TPA: hypothetical protein V6C71_10970, partial [Coleofasciculaceae cyanobacterium]
ELPDGLEIKILEETSNTLYLVIPRNPLNAEVTEDLSEEALESVAGGGNIVSVGIAAGLELGW